MNETTKAVLKDIFDDILEQLDEVKSDINDSHNRGRLLAYVDTLKTVRSYIDKDVWRDFGIDFDIDSKYLQA